MRNEDFVINLITEKVDLNLKSIYKVLVDCNEKYSFNINGSIYYCCIFVISGELTIINTQKSSFNISEGKAVFLWSNEFDSYIAKKENTRFFSVYFMLKNQELILMQPFDLDDLIKTTNDLDYCIRLLKRSKILSLMKANMLFTKYVLEGVKKLTNIVEKSNVWYQAIILKSVDYINEHLFEELTAQALANMADMSLKQYRKYFKCIVGVFPSKYIAEKKMESAKDFLVNTNLSIQAIAKMMGYSSPYYFSNCFKEKFGCTPSEYRKRFNKG